MNTEYSCFMIIHDSKFSFLPILKVQEKYFLSGEEKNGLRKKKHHCHTMWIRGDEPVSDHKVHPGHNNFGMTSFPTQSRNAQVQSYWASTRISYLTYVRVILRMELIVFRLQGVIWLDTDRCFCPCFTVSMLLLVLLSHSGLLAVAGHKFLWLRVAMRPSWLLCGAV